jgi:hypothetical protein
MRVGPALIRSAILPLTLAAATLICAGQTSPDVGKAPQIPGVGRLGLPRSFKQVGLPIAATRAAIPADNAETPAKIALGQKLFFDGQLSADGTVACSTCHDPAHAFTDGRPVSIGIKGRAGQRNAPTILNALYNKTQFWDGRATTLEQQAPNDNSYAVFRERVSYRAWRGEAGAGRRTRHQQAVVLSRGDRGVHGVHDLSGLPAYSPKFVVLRNSHRSGRDRRLVGHCGISAC